MHIQAVSDHIGQEIELPLLIGFLVLRLDGHGVQALAGEQPTGQGIGQLSRVEEAVEIRPKDVPGHGPVRPPVGQAAEGRCPLPYLGHAHVDLIAV